MTAKLRKLTNNFSPHAIRVLGLVTYIRFLLAFLLRLPSVFAARDLKPVDRAMGPIASRFYVRGRAFRFDCAKADEGCRDGTYAFGIAREVFIRNCYLRHHRKDLIETCRTVVDLGANRGAFSSMMTPFATRIVAVEANSSLVPIIQHNLRLNGITEPRVEAVFVGAGGDMAAVGSAVVALSTLFDRHDLQVVDFLKIDIEGSEFGLFQAPSWLSRVQNLSMEVHPKHGDPQVILEVLENAGFGVTMADENLKVVPLSTACTYLYASRPLVDQGDR